MATASAWPPFKPSPSWDPLPSMQQVHFFSRIKAKCGCQSRRRSRAFQPLRVRRQGRVWWARPASCPCGGAASLLRTWNSTPPSVPSYLTFKCFGNFSCAASPSSSWPPVRPSAHTLSSPLSSMKNSFYTSVKIPFLISHLLQFDPSPPVLPGLPTFLHHPRPGVQRVHGPARVRTATARPAGRDEPVLRQGSPTLASHHPHRAGTAVDQRECQCRAQDPREAIQPLRRSWRETRVQAGRVHVVQAAPPAGQGPPQAHRQRDTNGPSGPSPVSPHPPTLSRIDPEFHHPLGAVHCPLDAPPKVHFALQGKE